MGVRCNNMSLKMLLCANDRVVLVHIEGLNEAFGRVSGRLQNIIEFLGIIRGGCLALHSHEQNSQGGGRSGLDIHGFVSYETSGQECKRGAVMGVDDLYFVSHRHYLHMRGRITSNYKPDFGVVA